MMSSANAGCPAAPTTWRSGPRRLRRPARAARPRTRAVSSVPPCTGRCLVNNRAPRATPRELATARWDLARLVPRAGAGLVTGTALVNLAAGVLPVVFVVATSVVLGRVPGAVKGGLGPA